MGTFVVCLILIAVVAFVIFRMVSQKKKGKMPCGCSCCSGDCGCGTCGKLNEGNTDIFRSGKKCKIIMEISGMKCSGCKEKLQREIENTFDVIRCSVNYKIGKVVIITKNAFTKKEMEDVCRNLGFELIYFNIKF